MNNTNHMSEITEKKKNKKWHDSIKKIHRFFRIPKTALQDIIVP